ncbi:Lysophosphatidylcholine acyltransferase 2 [Chamberlinius hualienensis]
MADGDRGDCLPSKVRRTPPNQQSHQRNNHHHHNNHINSQHSNKNPFVNNLELDTYNKIKVAVLTVTILPVRILFALALLTLAWILGHIGLYGHSEEFKHKPMTGWRKDLKVVICMLLRAMFFVAGFHWVNIKGKRVPVEEAPVLVLAPHSSLFDTLPVIMMGAPSLVIKVGAENSPFFGKLIEYTQPVYVCREDKDSRQSTIVEIQRRATSDGHWSQVLIFPEGTCTNRSSLIAFKPGAFYPGVPVQPVCIKYPNKLDTITWTWEGPGALKLLWLSLCQFHNYCEIEYLPVYRPNEEEIKHAQLFADNVRQEMANVLGCEVSEYSYDDCRLMSKAAESNLPYERGLVKVKNLREKLGLDQHDVEAELTRYSEICRAKDGLLTLEDFSAYLNLPVTEPALKELFSLYDLNGCGKIDFRQYLIGVSVISKPLNTEDAVQLAFKLFDRDGKSCITKKDLYLILNKNLNMNLEETERLFVQVDRSGKGYITYDEFKECAQRKPEYAKIFQSHRRRYQQAKKLKVNGSKMDAAAINSNSISNNSKHTKED